MSAGSADGLGRRPERAEDESFLFALFSAVQGAPLAGLDPALRTMLLRQGFAGQHSSYRARYPHARYDVLERDGAPVGRLIRDEAAEAVTLVAIALLPEWRGLGLGTRLVREVCDAAQAAGRPVLLTVDAANLAAQRLYVRLGFVPVGATDTDIAMRRG